MNRNRERFSSDFMFQLTKEELENWKSQFVISNLNIKMSLRKNPLTFTEQGVAMLSGVLRSPQSIAVNIEVMRSFIKLRQTLAIQKELSKDLKEVKNFMLKHSNANDQEFKKIWQTINELSKPLKNNRQKIGFKLN